MAEAASGSSDKSVQVKLVLLGMHAGFTDPAASRSEQLYLR